MTMSYRNEKLGLSFCFVHKENKKIHRVKFRAEMMLASSFHELNTSFCPFQDAYRVLGAILKQSMYKIRNGAMMYHFSKAEAGKGRVLIEREYPKD